MKKDIENKLTRIGNSFGITKQEIKDVIKRRRHQAIFAAIIPIAFIGFGSMFYAFGVRYGGINIEDFRIFRILRFLFGL